MVVMLLFYVTFGCGTSWFCPSRDMLSWHHGLRSRCPSSISKLWNETKIFCYILLIANIIKNRISASVHLHVHLPSWIENCTDQTVPRRAVWSGSTLFAIPSASFGLITLMVEPHSSNFRVITTNCLGVRTFRKFTVIGHFDPVHLG